MRRLKKIKVRLFSVGFSTIFIFFISLSFLISSVYSQEFDEEVPDEMPDYIEIVEDAEFGMMYIPFGKTVVVKKGVTLTLSEESIVEGKLIIKGTVKEPVKIKKSEGAYGYSIRVDPGGEVEIMNAEIIQGGWMADFVERKRSIFFNVAYADAAQGAIHVKGGKFSAQNTTFENNVIAVSINGNDSVAKVNRSRFINSSRFEVVKSGSLVTADFRYNWWGNEKGPVMNCEIYPACWPVSGSIDSSRWLSKSDFLDPVILVPGILGSHKKDGKWHMDLTFHTYDNLYQEFAANGYVPDITLFEFPYEWRDSNIDNALLLKNKIQEIKEKNNWPKVDIVAHSMGGLLARQYIESANYQDDIDQLITLGTPHNGAPSAYLKWDGDGWFFDLADIYTKHIIRQEAKKSGYADIFDYVHERPISSLQELLPVYDYLQEVQNNYELRKYPDNYPRNEFLENLNKKENLEKLRSVESNKIIGKVGSDMSTISGFKVIDADMGKYWEHGYPHGFEVLIGDRGLLKSDGDRTVPLESAQSENVPADNVIEISANHRDLPTEAQKDILEILTNVRPEKENRDSLIKDILIMSVYSPIDIQVISPSGKWAGKNIKNLDPEDEIKDSYYSGQDASNEFLTIPNPENIPYTIVAEGTGNGEFKIEIAKIEENESGQAQEMTAEISGVAEEGKREEKIINVQEEKIQIQENTEEEITPESIRLDVKKYYAAGLITQKSTRIYLEVKLEIIQKMMELLKKVESTWLPPKAKEKIIRNFQKNINRQIEQLQKELEKNKTLKKTVQEEARKSLIEKLESVKI